MAETEKSKPKAALTLETASALVNQPADGCLAFKDYGETVVVVTKSGQKLSFNKATNEIINLLTGDVYARARP